MNIPFINDALGWVLSFIADLTGGSFAISIFLFTLLINLALIPLSIKSQKSSVQQTRIKPKLDELKKRYGDDRQKFATAQQKLYQEENISMSGGCLPMILRLVLMMCIYGVILSPLTYLMGGEKADVNTVKSSPAVISVLDKKNVAELDIIEGIEKGKLTADKLEATEDDKDIAKVEKAVDSLTRKVKESDLKFHLMGIDLTQTPKWSFDIFGNFEITWLMPIIAFLAQIITSLISMKMQKITNPDAPSMSGMLLTMPLVSLFIGFSLPGGVTFYWACSSLIGGLIQTGIQFFYGPHKMLAKERIKELSKQCDFEDTQIKKHLPEAD